MPVQSGNRVSWTYTDDNGTDWAISAKGALVLHATDAAKYGGSAAAASVPQIPGNFKPRRVCCVDASGNQRYIIAYDTTCALWATPGTSVTLNYFGSDVAFTSTNRRRGEKSNKRGTYQSA